MKRRFYISFFIFCVLSFFQPIGAKNTHFLASDTISVISDSVNHKYIFLKADGTWENDSVVQQRLDSLVKLPLNYTDSLLYHSNSLLVPLVFMGKELKPITIPEWDKINLSFGQKDFTFIPKPKTTSTEELVAKLRNNVRDEITRTHADWYYATYDELPALSSFMQQRIRYKPIGTVPITEKLPHPEKGKIKIDDIEKMYWQKKARALFQFSQNYISSNWYQGGNSNLALLSILSGQLLYDNLKNIQWENNVEWRAGFNSVAGDTLRKIATNDDLLRYTTKFGIKAFGNWYYSVSSEVSTQLFDNYKGINSNEFKSRLFTPVRVNIGVGMDYKYKKIFSMMIAPVSFKYIYANDTTNVNPNLFGIEKGENHLSEIGSSLKATLCYSPMMNWQIDSRLTFFTNYKKVETDWEIVNNFNFNRFISARLSFNPRYDNTIILKEGEKSKIQFKQLLSIGLSFRLL
ncbi:conserved exported hypothetical protein [uncultured Paludibacter sp.]|nr:conserved exported hypothetical protein [uncultured Paludibacter sp.]